MPASYLGKSLLSPGVTSLGSGVGTVQLTEASFAWMNVLTTGKFLLCFRPPPGPAVCQKNQPKRILMPRSTFWGGLFCHPSKAKQSRYGCLEPCGVLEGTQSWTEAHTVKAGLVQGVVLEHNEV